MEKKEKKTYESPQLTVATIKAERGYAFSRGIRLGSAWTNTVIGAWSGAVAGGNNIGTAWINEGNDAWVD